MSLLTDPSHDPSGIVLSQDTRICVLMNSGSGSGDAEDRAETMRAAFDRHPNRFELRLVDPGDGIADACQRAMKDGFGTIVAAGGDGTIAGVAGQVAGTGRRLGIVPLGTFNYVARGLKIPEDIDAAIDLLAEGETRAVPVGEVNGTVFLNNASLGIYPQVLKEREGTYARWGRSRIAAHWSVLMTFLTFRRPMRMSVNVGGTVQRRRTPLAFIGRSAFQLEYFGLEGSDAVERGEFALYVAPDSTRWELLLRALRLASKGMVLNRDFELFTGRDIVIETSRRTQTVAMDGERFKLTSPFRFRMHDNALHVVLPPERKTPLESGGPSEDAGHGDA
ncbi:diacylglycerol kinase catalytic subunit [Roseivivax marinus]|uniref:Diacylglycerol kinase catalytic subunit n=1 Tax=Roseivivax marinus TaxID=1379903 RepID=W4HLV1_9RHOB|nr:diacylglycerol kinase family protein [Roseivivax marinus]ETW13091.1 diacylglycerol kinase catalytic subunit [Roseivivax marinus]